MSYRWCMVNKFTNHIYQISFSRLFKSLVKMLPNLRVNILTGQITCKDVDHAIIVNTGHTAGKT